MSRIKAYIEESKILKTPMKLLKVNINKVVAYGGKGSIRHLPMEHSVRNT